MTEQTTTTVIETSSVPETKNDAVDHIVESAIGLGRLWARHGLTIGKLALETSALSLGTTARLLGEIAEAFASDASPTESSEKP